MYELNLIQTPNQQFLAVLENQNCTMRLRQLGSQFFFTLIVDQDVICENALVTLNQKIIQIDTDRFNGNFVLCDPDNLYTSKLPDYSELGTKYRLFYISDDEIA